MKEQSPSSYAFGEQACGENFHAAAAKSADIRAQTTQDQAAVGLQFAQANPGTWDEQSSSQGRLQADNAGLFWKTADLRISRVIEGGQCGEDSILRMGAWR